jgi:amino-acid N-acetyltransferase
MVSAEAPRVLEIRGMRSLGASLQDAAAVLRDRGRIMSSRPAFPCPTPTLRPATAADQAAIRALVRGERLNPHGLDWPRFLLATIGPVVVGAVQMRLHADGSRELASLVVARDFRGHGLAGRLVECLLASHTGPVHVITARANARHYTRWCFRAVPALRTPASVRRNFCLGQLAGVIALLRGRTPRRLVVLERA